MYTRIIEKLSIDYKANIQTLTAPLKEHLDIPTFFKHTVYPDSRYTIIHNQPEAAAYYLENKLYLNNPFLLNPENIDSGSLLGLAVPFSNFHIAQQEINTRFSMANQLYIYRKIDNALHIYGFATNSVDILNQVNYLSKLPLLNAFIDHFEEAGKEMLEELAMYSIPLGEIMGKDRFYNYNPWPEYFFDMELEKRIQFLHQINALPESLQTMKPVSKREFECLNHLVDGLSCSKIATEVGLASGTVENYYDNVKIKLGCHSKQELFSLITKLKSYGLYPYYLFKKRKNKLINPLITDANLKS